MSVDYSVTEFSAFELLVDPDSLMSLEQGLVAFGAGGETGVDGAVPSVWIASEAGDQWCLSVEARDLAFKFEVFRLAIETPSEICARLGVASAEALDDLGEFSAPATMQNWPFAEWTLHVVRRCETDGTSSCWVAVGLLFSAAKEQLLVAVDHSVCDFPRVPTRSKTISAGASAFQRPSMRRAISDRE